MKTPSPASPKQAPTGDIWVFGYGSLMWQPNFEYAEKRPARLHGYHRALCVYSFEYRGTEETPGLVFGLDHGGSCRGIAFRVLEKNAKAVMQYLYEREMITGVYHPCWHPIELLDETRTPSEKASAYIFVADTSHRQYAGKLADNETIKLIQQGHGKAGPCIDYVENTLQHLHELGINDRSLERIVKKVRQSEKGNCFL